MKQILVTIGLLVMSNIFMSFAWYGHLKNLKEKPLLIAIAVSWLIAFFEYSLQVPANRIGNQVLHVSQLKILQEAISLTVFVPFAFFFLKEKITWNYIAAALLIFGAVLLVFLPMLKKG
jgi:uncharacterized protein (DUF486 family)